MFRNPVQIKMNLFIMQILLKGKSHEKSFEIEK
jgi:hypothetical protein